MHVSVIANTILNIFEILWRLTRFIGLFVHSTHILSSLTIIPAGSTRTCLYFTELCANENSPVPPMIAHSSFRSFGKLPSNLRLDPLNLVDNCRYIHMNIIRSGQPQNKSCTVLGYYACTNK